MLMVLGCGLLRATADTLTNAADVLALPDDKASLGVPVFVKGVVTAAETNWNGRFFIQDSSGGVFVESTEGFAPSVDDDGNAEGLALAGTSRLRRFTGRKQGRAFL